MSRIDFEKTAQELTAKSQSLLREWFPNGKLKGKEFVVGSVAGEKGESLSINTETGLWSDFASGEKGGDLISLYAAIHNIGQTEAAQQLGGVVVADTTRNTPQPKLRPTPRPKLTNTRFKHYRLGHPTETWSYHNVEGDVIQYVARYDDDVTCKKEFVPWIFNGQKWTPKSLPDPRPLYRLNAIANTKKHVLIVEGEKTAESAMVIASKIYEATTWPGGARSHKHADWSVLSGRRVLIWPDADTAGQEAGNEIAEILHAFDSTAEIKILDVSDRPSKWDATDALDEGMTWEQFQLWARSCVKVFKKDTLSQLTGLQLWTKLGLELNRSGLPHNDMDNVCRVIEGAEELQGVFYYDEFHTKFFTTWNDKKEQFTDAHALELTRYIQSRVGMRTCKTSLIHEAVATIGKRNTRNEVKDWMESLKWDGIPRINSIMHKAFMANHNEYTESVGKCWMIGIVARIYEPGQCKVDNMVIFEGNQGIGKSTALQALAGADWFDDCSLPVSHPDFANHMEGKLIVDLGELSSFSKTEVLHIKQMLSSPKFRYRKKYARNTEDIPRLTTITGSTNTYDWNKDETGARRFWPIRCLNKVDVGWLRDNRDQLFAEAVKRFKDKESWWDVPEDLAKKEQDDRFDFHPWTELIKKYINLYSVTELSIPQIMEEVLGTEKSRWNKKDSIEIGKILRKLGWVSSSVSWDMELQKTTRIFIKEETE